MRRTPAGLIGLVGISCVAISVIAMAQGLTLPSMGTVHSVGGSPSPPNPSDPALMVWVKADSGAGAVNNDPVATWVLSGGTGSNFTQATGANRCLYKTNILNSLPVVSCDNSNDSLSTGSISHGIGTGDFYVAAVARTSSLGVVYRTLWAMGTFAPAFYMSTGAGGNPSFYQGANNSFGNPFSNSVWYIIEVWRSSGVVHVWTNGVEDGTTPTVAGSIANAAFHLNFDGSAAPGGMDIAELIFYNGLPDLAGRTNVRNYLNGKWAVF